MNYTIARKKGGAISWTDEQVTYIINKYLNENYTILKIATEFGCSAPTIRTLLRKNKITLKGNKQGYPRDSFYFSNIDTEEKAYWLGFLYADGCVHSSNNEISINITDKDHVEKFKKAIRAKNHKIGKTEDKRFKNAKPLYHFSIKDAQLHSDLIKWGCIPNKSLKIEKIPNIPRDYTSHFIRGYFDGDGSLHYLKGSNNYRISFIGTKSFLQDIQKELEVQKISLGYGSAGKAYTLQIAGRKQVIKILKFLYSNSSDSNRLNRKYKIYQDCLKWALSH